MTSDEWSDLDDGHRSTGQRKVGGAPAHKVRSRPKPANVKGLVAIVRRLQPPTQQYA